VCDLDMDRKIIEGQTFLSWQEYWMRLPHFCYERLSQDTNKRGKEEVQTGGMQTGRCNKVID